MGELRPSAVSHSYLLSSKFWYGWYSHLEPTHPQLLAQLMISVIFTDRHSWANEAVCRHGTTRGRHPLLLFTSKSKSEDRITLNNQSCFWCRCVTTFCDYIYKYTEDSYIVYLWITILYSVDISCYHCYLYSDSFNWNFIVFL